MSLVQQTWMHSNPYYIKGIVCYSNIFLQSKFSALLLYPLLGPDHKENKNVPSTHLDVVEGYL